VLPTAEHLMPSSGKNAMKLFPTPNIFINPFFFYKITF